MVAGCASLASATAATSTPAALSPTSGPPTLTLAPTPTPTATPDPRQLVIGHSVLGRPIDAYRLGDGPIHMIVISGLHGGYEWNTILLAHEFIGQAESGSITIPPHLSIFVIPSANPDGLAAVTQFESGFTAADISGDLTAGRINANGVDLNRNWACNWQPTAEWRGGTVSAGSAPFSEPEVAAVRDYIEQIEPVVVVFWHSAAGGVFAGGCGVPDVFAEGQRLARQYAQAAGYVRSGSGSTGNGRFTAYEITGDAANWVAKQGIPALIVELRTHDQIEFDENWRGLQALFDALTP